MKIIIWKICFFGFWNLSVFFHFQTPPSPDIRPHKRRQFDLIFGVCHRIARANDNNSWHIIIHYKWWLVKHWNIGSVFYFFCPFWSLKWIQWFDLIIAVGWIELISNTVKKWKQEIDSLEIYYNYSRNSRPKDKQSNKHRFEIEYNNGKLYWNRKGPLDRVHMFHIFFCNTHTHNQYYCIVGPSSSRALINLTLESIYIFIFF